MKITDIYCEITVKGTPLLPFVKHPSVVPDKWVPFSPKPNAPNTFFTLVTDVAPGTYASLIACLGTPGAANTVQYLYQKDAVVIPVPVVVDFYLATNNHSDAPAATYTTATPS